MGNQYPKSIKEAVGLLSSELSEKDKQAIRNIPNGNEELEKGFGSIEPREH
jgi:hypothetical protein